MSKPNTEFKIDLSGTSSFLLVRSKTVAFPWFQHLLMFIECYEVMIFGNKGKGRGEGTVIFSNVAPR